MTNKRIFKDGVERTAEFHEVVKWKEIIELIADKLLGETLESKVMVTTRRQDQKEGTGAPQQSARRRIFPLSCNLARPSPVFPPLQTEICEAVCGEKLGRLIGQSPNLTWRGPGRNMPKKRKRRGTGGKEKKMNHFSQELGVRTSGWQSTRKGCLGDGTRINSPVKKQVSGWGWKLKVQAVCHRSTFSYATTFRDRKRNYTTN